MGTERATNTARRTHAWVTADEWFSGGRRIWYDPASARVPGDNEAARTPSALRVFDRVVGDDGTARDEAAVWLTMLPGFPDGSYGWAQVDRAHAAARTTIAAVFILVNGGLFADAHTHPLRGTPMLRSPLGALAARGSQRSAAVFARGWQQARMYSRDYHPTSTELTELWSALTRHDGAAFMHDGAGFVKEHRRHAQRWDLAAIARELNGTVGIYIGGSDEDPYEHRQIAAARERVPEAEIVTFPRGHLTTSEHPDLLAEAIRRIYAIFDTERSSS